jgi:hypothetical protein
MEDAADAMTVKVFCARNAISAPTYYALRKLGLGPDEIRIGAVVRISREAAARWRAARESPTGAEAEQVARDAALLRERSRRAIYASVASPMHVSKRA